MDFIGMNGIVAGATPFWNSFQISFCIYGRVSPKYSRRKKSNKFSLSNHNRTLHDQYCDQPFPLAWQEIFAGKVAQLSNQNNLYSLSGYKKKGKSVLVTASSSSRLRCWHVTSPGARNASSRGHGIKTEKCLNTLQQRKIFQFSVRTNAKTFVVKRIGIIDAVFLNTALSAGLQGKNWADDFETVCPILREVESEARLGKN